MKGIGKATENRTLVSKVHRPLSGGEPTAKRNRMTRSRTKCGTALTWTWPFEVTEMNACQLCYPDLRPDPVTAEARRVEQELATQVQKLDIGVPILLDVSYDGDEPDLKEFVPIDIRNDGTVTITMIDRKSYEDQRRIE